MRKTCPKLKHFCTELGQIKVRGSLVAIDQVQLRELDNIDVGGKIRPQGVVPAIVKSLFFL